MRRPANAPVDLLAEREVAGVADAERLRDGRDHQVGILHRREIDERDAVGERGLDLAGGGDGEPALADAARTR